MRRPSFCCDQHGAGDNKCQPKEGGESTLSRVRRFLAVSMGGRGGGAVVPSQATPCKHHHAPPDPRHALPDPLNAPAHALTSLLTEMKEAGVGVQGVLGRPLEEVMAAHAEDASGHGVPTLVHLLCCYILTHGVDYDSLVSEDWCAEEVRTRLLLERGEEAVPSDTTQPGSDTAVATGVLRLFLDELPDPLIPPAAATKIMPLIAERGVVDECEGQCDEAILMAVVPRLRRVLHRLLPISHLCLLRYLAAFIHQLRTSNHNTCPVPVAALSRVLSRVLVRGGGGEWPSGVVARLGEVIILAYTQIFTQQDDDQDLSDSVSSPSSGGDEGGGDGDTTSTDTDDFRSPPVSPQKTGRGRCAPRPPPLTPSSPRLDDVGGGGSVVVQGGGGWKAPWTPRNGGGSGSGSGNGDIGSGSGNGELPLDLASPVTFDPGAPTTRVLADPTAVHEHRWTPRPEDGEEGEGSSHAGGHKRKEHEEGRAGGEHDPKFIRSTREVVNHLDTNGLTFAKDIHVGSSGAPSSPVSPSSPDDVYSPSTQDDDDDVTSQDAWETGGDSDVRDEDDDPQDDDDDTHAERRVNERSFHRAFPQASRRTRRRTKKRHHSHSPQDGNLRYQSSEDDVRSPTCLRSLTSEEEEPTRFDPTPSDVVRCQPTTAVRPTSPRREEPALGLSELLNAGEPVTSDRGHWGMREASHSDSWHRMGHRYNRYEDETSTSNNWYRNDEDDVVVSPRTSGDYSDTPPLGPNDYAQPAGQGAVKILMKNINSIKKKIKRYEEEFESAFGYRPSHSEKMKHKEIKKYMSELSKARKELKQMKDDVAGMMSVPTVFPLSLLRCQESTNPNARPTKISSGTADTIRQVEDRLREKRSAQGRPADLINMNNAEMQDEKTALQKALLYYESVHGRPSTREDRDLARPLYDRYRQVKRIVMKSSSRTKENIAELAPILEHEAMDFTLASPQHRGQTEDMEKISLPPSPPSTPPVFDSPISETAQTITCDDQKDGRSTVALGDLHALPLGELRERKKEARDEKKKLRRALREFEETFERDLGRKVQKEDRGPMEQTYLDYKHAKAKLRLLEALLSKHEPHKV